MNNIELKVKMDSHAAIKEVLGHNPFFRKEAQLIQTDIYFNTQHGRMKLRAINNEHHELIYYERPDVHESKLSAYEIMPLTCEQYLKFKIIFEKTIGIFVIVKKKRDLWKYNHTRIHLDEVDKLGNYLELETILDNDFDMKEAQNEHHKVINLLNLFSYTKCAESYSDLLIISGR